MNAPAETMTAKVKLTAIPPCTECSLWSAKHEPQSTQSSQGDGVPWRSENGTEEVPWIQGEGVRWKEGTNAVSCPAHEAVSRSHRTATIPQDLVTGITDLMSFYGSQKALFEAIAEHDETKVKIAKNAMLEFLRDQGISEDDSQKHIIAITGEKSQVSMLALFNPDVAARNAASTEGELPVSPL